MISDYDRSGPIWSSRLQASKIPRTGESIRWEANPAQRKAISEALNLPSLGLLRADFLIKPAAGGQFRVTGSVNAEIEQICGVSLEAFPVSFHEVIDVRFAPAEQIEMSGTDEIERNLDEDDPPEPLYDDTIDVGQMAYETVSLGLDPYPRKPGVSLPEAAVDVRLPGPFAALAALKKS
jgi:uncharacterized metal-binding protein YceD (DUF177 family)